ncbi:MAG TPA: serine/threonine-protein kinase [Burkholderiaceae bacterium]|nr:serine/threonine-protein kinase [Burkholderiaceae bacterium]
MSEPYTATVPLDPLDAPVPAPPKTIGRFTILNEIGRGSYGVVYAAHDPVLAREVAIKIIPLAREDQFRTQIEASFLHEAKSAGGMSHPSIVTIYDAGKTDSFAYIAMERLHGQDLHEYLASGNRMSPRQSAAMMMRVADAIHYANKRGLVHRDIKPSNIFLSRDLKPKLLDFGTALAPVPETKLRGTRQLVGTPNYMSPEQADGGTLDARSDIFSLGTILYELLCGRRAFDGRTVDETLDQVLSANPKSVDRVRPETPPALVEIVRKAMAREPAARYQKAAELRNALADFVDGSRAPAADTSVATRAIEARVATAPARKRALSGRALVSIVTGAVAIIVLVAALRREQPPPARVEPVAPVVTVQPVTAPPVEPPPAPLTETIAAEAAALEKQAADARAAAAARRKIEPPPAPVPPPRDGTVALAVSPWGEITVDGVERGVSPPLTQLTLAPGVHTIEIRNGSGAPFIARVEVKSGETLALQHRF